MRRGRKRFGYYPDEASVVEIVKIKRRRRKGAAGPTSYGQIARELNVEGFKTQMGKWFTAQTVKNILNPAVSVVVKKYPRAEQPHKYWTVTEMGRIFAECRTDRERAIMELLVGSGLRRGEFAELQVRDIAFKGSGGLVKVLRGKGFVKRDVILAPKLADFMREYMRDYRKGAGLRAPLFEGLSYKNLYYLTTKLGRRAGLTELANPHSFRHTFATILYDNTRNLILVQQQLGHRSTETTAIYTKCLDTKSLSDMGLFDRALHQRGVGGQVGKFPNDCPKTT